MASQKAQEIWECTTGGTVYVNVKDPRHADAWTQKKVGGKGTKRITLTVEEREFNQELVPYEKKQFDPFLNGKLVRISPKDDRELTDDALVERLKGLNDEAFDEWLNAIDSEIVVRRLHTLAREHSTVARYETIGDLIAQRYSIGKTSRVVAEIMEDDQKYARADF